jgi:hypothetical protein
MATKKQKHAMMLEKRAAREAAAAEIGRKALEADRARRAAEEARKWEDAHKTHLKRNRFHPECEHCNKIKAQQAIDKLAKASAKAAKAEIIIDEALTDEEARRMDEESIERVKGVMRELGFSPEDQEKVSA